MIPCSTTRARSASGGPVGRSACDLGASVTRGHHLLVALRLAAAETWPSAGASVLPIVVLLMAELLGAPRATAAWTALVATTVLGS